MHSWARSLAWGLELRARKACVVGPGVAVRLDTTGEHVAVVYGGHENSVDYEAVTRAARAALVDWPEPIARLEISVSPDPHAATARERARAKRERRAARPQGRS
jgi:hypothetical protein